MPEVIAMKEFAEQFYQSRQWKQCRAAYIKSVGGLCEDWLKKGIYTPGKVVHHKETLTPQNIDDPLITLSRGNLKLVCQDCHAKEHTREKRYKFDLGGRICPP